MRRAKLFLDFNRFESDLFHICSRPIQSQAGNGTQKNSEKIFSTCTIIGLK